MSIADKLKTATKSVTKEWTAQRKAEERGRSRSSRFYVYSDRVNFSDVADQILPAAYEHASGGGRYSVSKRQLYYASRQKFLELTGRQIDYPYFANTLVVQYVNRHPEETSRWKITADPRGTLTIPHATSEVRIPCGTIQIDEHLSKARRSHDLFSINPECPIEWPSLAPGVRYQGVLYIEKEGFEPLMNEAGISEKFDLAVLSCKGQSVVAARKYVDQVCAMHGGVPLFVVHDMDKAGFEIAQRLTQVSAWAEAYDRITYDFENEINVHDLGLRLADVEDYDLEDETCDFKGHFARDSICTDEEKQFLQSGRRVELNAFSSPDFIAWLTSKLDEHLSERLIPNADVLEDAFRRALVVCQINHAANAAYDAAVRVAEQATVPEALQDELKLAMSESDDNTAWDAALYRLVESLLYPEEGDT